jgi:hypothetical protein
MSPVLLYRVGQFLHKHWQLSLFIAVLLALGAYIAVLRNQLTDAIIAKNNAEAAADTLKVKYRDDSTVVVGILAFQSDQLKTLRDSLDLAGKSKVNTQLTVKPKPKRETHAPPPEPWGETVLLYDSVVGPPVDIKAAVALTPEPDSTVSQLWEWQIDPTPIPLTVDVGCLERLKPDVLVRSPPWATIEDVTTNVTTDVCDSEKKKHGVGHYLVRAGVAVGLFVGGALAF